MKFDRDKLLKWLNKDPYREAMLIASVPVKSSTLNRIKSGSYVPGPILATAIMAVIAKDPDELRR